jgi:C_GCAxxG_C_C family probable redox protein
MGLQGGLMAGEVCGAVSGAVLAIGLLFGEEQPEAATHLTEEFLRRFSEQKGAVRCIDIVGFNAAGASTGDDLSSVKGLLWFLARGGKRVCKKAVSSAVEVLLEQLEQWET